MKHVVSDLLKLAKEGEFDVIFHGCNCFNAMGSGIALGVKKVFPEATQRDLETIKGDKLKLGATTSVVCSTNDGGEVTVVNAYTQHGFNPKESPLNYQALELCLRQIRTQYHDKRIGYPAIGAGLGGGDWNKIYDIIKRVFDGLDHTYVEYDENN